MIVTKYANVPTGELISLCIDKRAHSPLIEELCQRLENGDKGDFERDLSDFNNEITCPVCESTLDIEDHETHFTVKVTRN